MRNTILGLILGALATAGCSGPTSGAASLSLAPTVPTAPAAGMQFGVVGSALSYDGVWLVTLPDGGIQDAGPAISVELYNSGPGVACYQQFGALTPYIADAGPGASNNASLYPAQGQWAAWIDFGGFPNSGLETGSVPLVPAAFGVGVSGLGASVNIEEINGFELTSVSGSIDIQTAAASGITGTISGVAVNPLFVPGGPYSPQPGDIGAVFAAGIEGPQFDADADAGAPEATLYDDALDAALDAGSEPGDAGLVAQDLAEALLGDPDAGGSFTLQGSFSSPFCPTPYIPLP